jgi:hypothetical protein
MDMVTLSLWVIFLMVQTQSYLVLVLAVQHTEYWKIWIDYNQNGTFETSEEIVTGSLLSSANLKNANGTMFLLSR